jgi:Icc-related predicted phosphoesterase
MVHLSMRSTARYCRRVRYLVASDLHYGLAQLDWIAEQAPEFDAVILAGDHLDAGGYADLAAQITLITLYLGQLADVTRVFANSGNHDLTGRRDHGEKAAVWLDAVDQRVVTDGRCKRVGDDLVSVCAWWEGPTTRGELERQLEADAVHRPESGRWIWVYHSPPDESPTSWSGSRHYGDDVLNALIAAHRPDIVLTGHVHESPFRPGGSWCDRIGSTLVLNAGRQLGPVPAHLIVDTGADEVMWWSSQGSATRPIAGQ